MATLTFPYPAVAGTKIKSAEYNANNAAVSTLLNTTKLNDDNLQDAGISGTKLVAGTLTDTQISAIAGIARSKVANEAISTQTTTYTALTTDDSILCNAAGGAFTVTLYAASGNSGKILRIKKTDSSFNLVTIDGNGSETIDGSTTKKLATQHEDIVLLCDGSNWRVVSRFFNQEPFDVTLTSNLFTNTTLTAKCTRRGAHAEFEVLANCTGTPGAADFGFSLPTGLTIDTAKLADSTNFNLSAGSASILDSSVPQVYAPFPVIPISSTAVKIWLISTSASYSLVSGFVNNTAPMTFAVNDKISMRFLVPITGWEG